jgi:hypothetical protein
MLIIMTSAGNYAARVIACFFQAGGRVRQPLHCTRFNVLPNFRYHWLFNPRMLSRALRYLCIKGPCTADSKPLIANRCLPRHLLEDLRAIRLPTSGKSAQVDKASSGRFAEIRFLCLNAGTSPRWAVYYSAEGFPTASSLRFLV